MSTGVGPFSITFPKKVEVADIEFPSGASSRGSHQLTSAATCEQLYTYKYLNNLRIVHEPPWRAIGSAIHEALAWHYAAKLPEEARPQIWAPDNFEELVMQASRNVQAVYDIAMDVYQFYCRRHSSESWTPVAVEQEYKATLGELDPEHATGTEEDDEYVTCRSDLIVEQNGGLYIVDHKCLAGNYVTGRLDRWQSDNEFTMSLQVMMNLHLVAMHYQRIGDPRPVKGFIIQRIKRKQPYEIDRNLVDISPRVLRGAPYVARQLVRREAEIKNKVKSGIPVTPNYSQCMGRYGLCDYYNVCSADTSEQAKSFLESAYTRK